NGAREKLSSSGVQTWTEGPTAPPSEHRSRLFGADYPFFLQEKSERTSLPGRFVLAACNVPADETLKCCTVFSTMYGPMLLVVTPLNVTESKPPGAKSGDVQRLHDDQNR